MLRASWKSLLGRKLRLFMSAFAIVLGVSFVSGSLDLHRHPRQAPSTASSTPSATSSCGPESAGDFDAAALERHDRPGRRWSATSPAPPGVARADGNVSDQTTFVVSKNGKLIGGGGAPGLGLQLQRRPDRRRRAAGRHSSPGRWPERAGRGRARQRAPPSGRATASATRHAGDQRRPAATVTRHPRRHRRVQVRRHRRRDAWRSSTPGPRRSSTSAAGTSTPTSGSPPRTATSQEDLADAVQAALPAGLEAVTGDAVAKESARPASARRCRSSTPSCWSSPAIALFVGSLPHHQHVLDPRRPAQPRARAAPGARRRPAPGDPLGAVRGVRRRARRLDGRPGPRASCSPSGIKALFAQFGLDLSGSPLVFQPAHRAGRVCRRAGRDDGRRLPARPPGGQDAAGGGDARRRRAARVGPALARAVRGSVLTVVGCLAAFLGAFTDDRPTRRCWVGRRASSPSCSAVALTSPVLGRPVIAAAGLVYRRLFGAVGVMAEQNAVRNPRRTAATASALMIGLDPGVDDVRVRRLGEGQRRQVDRAELRRRLRGLQRDPAAVLVAR